MKTTGKWSVENYGDWFWQPIRHQWQGDGLNKALDRGVKGLEFHRQNMDIHHEKMRAAWANYSSP